MEPAILNLLIGSALTLVVTLIMTVVNAILSSSKEERAEKRIEERNRRKEKIAVLEHLYQDALRSLNSLSLKGTVMHHQNDKEGTRKLIDDIASLQGRLALSSTQDIIDTFYLAMAIVTANVQQEIQQDKPQLDEAKEHLPFSTVYTQLAQLMKTHLDAESTLLRNV